MVCACGARSPSRPRETPQSRLLARVLRDVGLHDKLERPVACSLVNLHILTQEEVDSHKETQPQQESVRATTHGPVAKCKRRNHLTWTLHVGGHPRGPVPSASSSVLFRAAQRRCDTSSRRCRRPEYGLSAFSLRPKEASEPLDRLRATSRHLWQACCALSRRQSLSAAASSARSTWDRCSHRSRRRCPTPASWASSSSPSAASSAADISADRLIETASHERPGTRRARPRRAAAVEGAELRRRAAAVARGRHFRRRLHLLAAAAGPGRRSHPPRRAGTSCGRAG